MVSATFATRSGESQSVALRAKVIAAQSSEPVRSSAHYEVSLVGTFVQSIHGQVNGPPGLARPEIEELIERDWAMLSTETDVLLDSSWELKTFRELQS